MTEAQRPVINPSVDGDIDLPAQSPVERLSSILLKNPDKYTSENVDRVRQLVEYEVSHPDVRKPYRLLQDIKDFDLYYKLHPEWQDMSISELQRDKIRKGDRFYKTFNKWTKNNFPDKQSRKLVTEQVFSPRQKSWTSFTTVADWKEEHSRHPEWENQAPSGKEKAGNSGLRAFYQAFSKWRKKHADDPKKAAEYTSQVFLAAAGDQDKTTPIIRDTEVPHFRGKTLWRTLEPDERIRVIEERAQRVIAEAGELSYRTIGSSLEKAIYRYYPGKFPGLKAKLQGETPPAASINPGLKAKLQGETPPAASINYEKRLDDLIVETDVNNESAARVRKVLQYQKNNPGSPRPFKILQTVGDFSLYYQLHQEWHGKYSYELSKEHNSGAGGFIAALYKRVRQITSDEAERRELIEGIIKRKNIDRSTFSSIADWKDEFVKHSEWQGKNTSEIQEDSRGNAFYESFRKWVNENAKTPDEALEYRRTIFPNYKESHRRQKEIIRASEESLRVFVHSLANIETVDAQEFRKLIGLFGSSRAVDILYRTQPQFRGIPVERVKGFLADYLGGYLAGPSSFSIDDIEIAIEHLSEPNLREGLTESIKDHCLSFFHYNRETGNLQTDRQVVDEYFEILGLEIQQSDSEALKEVIAEVKEYYDNLFDLVRPEGMVISLKERRPFPDVNQLVNIKEIADKKRMLIADEMGLGKSASAILSKEILGVKQALVVVPSNVISTWTRYLSDGAGGYFQEGHAPRVLVVESPEALQLTDMESYDYVILSQERLSNGYMDGLLGLDYGMLIVDEVHKFKNLRHGVRAANLLDLSQKVEGNDGYVALLSGTPVPNKVEDLAMLLKLLYPERFSAVDDTVLVRNIIQGDIVDLRSLLIPRMQRKSLAESIAMPELHEKILEVKLSPLEREVYEVLMEDDELPANEKMRILRQFLLNPNSLDATPGIPSSKIATLEASLHDTFQRKDKVVMFVNGYIEGVIRGDTTIFDSLKLPEGVEIRMIEGEVSSAQREVIQRELQTSDKKILLVVSGQTADVGVDFSAAQASYFYNEPWTEYDRRQQLGRVYREGLSDDLESVTLITKDTIEEGIHRYIQIKMAAIEKLLRGIPISDLEKEMLEKGEKQPEEGLEVNAELAEYYFSAWDRMMKIFSHVKEIGEKDFQKFLTNYGREYAECYTDLGSRSYYANANRVVGTLVDTFVRERGQNASDTRILDIASGPEILKHHIPEPYQGQIVSIDINRHHFEGLEGGNKVVGSFLGLPFQEKSFDYANLALAWHYTGFAPSKGNYERLEILAQGNRILKEGGRLIVSNIYSREFKDEEKFKELVQALGFRVVEHYTGEIAVGNSFKSHVYTLQKEKDIDPTDIIAKSLSRETLDALKFKKIKDRLQDSRKIITDFAINGTSLGIRFNHEDLEILGEERNVMDLANLLKARHGGINNIPVENILDNNFGRIRIGKRYVLFKKLEKGPGVVVVK